MHAAQGAPRGASLATVLGGGLPPWRVAIELIAALCEVLDIAGEDLAVHGDIELRHVVLSRSGAVGVGGFGVERARTRAPEGAPVGPATDRYGLGYVAMRVLNPRRLPHPLPARGPDQHEDQVLDAVLAIDWAGLPASMHGDVQWFVAKLLSHAPADRPTPLETWRALMAFAGELEGPTLASWSAAACDGGGERRGPITEEIIPESVPTEEIRVPLRSTGPLPTGVVYRASRSDASTAIFDRDELRGALEAVRQASTRSSGPLPRRSRKMARRERTLRYALVGGFAAGSAVIFAALVIIGVSALAFLGAGG